MANANKPMGLTPHSYLNGTRWTGQTTVYYVAASQSTAIAIGDPVVPTGDSDSNGVAGVTLATGNADVSGTTGYILGACVGILGNTYPTAPTSQFAAVKVPASSSSAYYIEVCDDPMVVYEIQEDSVGNNLAHGDVWNGFDLVSAADNGYVSGWMLDSSTGGSSNKQVQVLRLVQRADNAIGQYAKWLVRIIAHPWNAPVSPF
jgi:hypothetical protein